MRRGSAEIMTYKEDFASRVKAYFADSVDKAEEINRVWRLTKAYFYEISNSLEGEAKILGDYIQFNDEDDFFEFSIRYYGLEFKKKTFSIEVSRIHGENVKGITIIECEDGKVNLDTDILDKYVSENIEKYLV